MDADGSAPKPAELLGVQASLFQVTPFQRRAYGRQGWQVRAAAAVCLCRDVLAGVWQLSPESALRVWR